MIILDKVHEFDNKVIQIPYYHRGHLSMRPDAKVWVCFLPGNLEEKIFPEIVLSPIDFQHWDDIWRVKLVVHDRAGILNDLFAILKDHSVNIVTVESVPTNRENTNIINAIVDARNYSSYHDGSYRKRGDELKDLFTLLFVRFEKDVTWKKGKPRVKINRIKALLETKNLFEKTYAKSLYTGKVPSVHRLSLIRLNHAKVQIQLPVEVVNSLHESNRYLITSDTEERYAKVHFYDKSIRTINPTLLFTEKMGALKAITSAFRRNGYNISTCLSHPEVFGEKAQADFILQIPDSLKDNSENSVRSHVEKILSGSELVNYYNIRIDYRKKFNSQGNGKRIQVGTSEEEGFTKPAGISSLPDQISDLLKRYEQERSHSFVPSEVLEKFSYIKNMAEKISFPHKDITNRPLFVSYAFKEATKFSKVRELGKKNSRFSVKDARSLNSEGVNSGILDIIKECSYFLGLWTEAGGSASAENPKLFTPSPWLLWELGVAQTLNFKWRLIISKNIDSEIWKKVAPGIHHYIFDPDDPDDYSNKVEAALSYLYDQKFSTDN